MPFCLRKCWDWEDLDAGGGSEDKADQAEESWQESSGAGDNVSRLTSTSRELQKKIFRQGILDCKRLISPFSEYSRH